MTDTATPTGDVLDGWSLPKDWTQGACDVFAEVLTQRPDLAGSDLASLEHASALTSAAERLDAVALAAGMVSTGSTGQTVVHPAAVEARLARTAAAQILARLAPPSPSHRQTASERGRAAARARWGGSGSVPIGRR
ncbi:hypothetical protein [Actinotalea sp. Marseille-Q4924]|uniref:hypothetical protein n=1 Tax=Actinotalea sp. Marseille-Q4924 TaxID=2866571 RepID=UPI001CE3BC95|nr:hypothetical protein [Actinotalea sp. Marseille-Q4924]